MSAKQSKSKTPATRSDTGDETDIEVVDVDDLIRKGQLAKIGTRE
jgi:hypothetical protein